MTDKDFTLACVIKLELDENGNIVEYFPQSRYDNRRGLEMHSYGEGPFCHFSIPRKWSGKPGVYMLYVDYKPMYIGESEDLESRFNMGYGSISPRNCYQGGQSTNCRINNLILNTYKNGKQVRLMFREIQERHEFEDTLIAQLRPPWNRTGGGRVQRIPPRKKIRINKISEEGDAMIDEIVDFDKFWQLITMGLREKTLIQNWTADRGNLRKGDFEAWYSGGNYISCDTPDAKNLQKVPKKDFEFMYDNWKAYIAGHVSRQHLIQKSRFTKYTISILHRFLVNKE